LHKQLITQMSRRLTQSWTADLGPVDWWLSDERLLQAEGSTASLVECSASRLS